MVIRRFRRHILRQSYLTIPHSQCSVGKPTFEKKNQQNHFLARFLSINSPGLLDSSNHTLVFFSLFLSRFPFRDAGFSLHVIWRQHNTLKSPSGYTPFNLTGRHHNSQVVASGLIRCFFLGSGAVHQRGQRQAVKPFMLMRQAP